MQHGSTGIRSCMTIGQTHLYLLPCQVSQETIGSTHNLENLAQLRNKNQHDLNSSVQVRQKSQYETTCNGDLNSTAVFTTFGKVQKLEKGQPVSLPEDKKVPIPPQARGPLSNRKKSRNSNNCGSPDPTQGKIPRW